MGEVNISRISLLIGTVMGQLSELLNSLKCDNLTQDTIYKRIVDITNSAAIQIHEIYYSKKDIQEALNKQHEEEYKKQEEQEKEQLLNKSIDYLEFTIRVHNCLKAENIHTIRDLVKRSSTDLLITPNLGRKSLKEIIETLEKHGLSLK